MKQSNGLYHVSYQVGEWLLHCLKLQFLWFYWVLRYGIFLGIFPATATIIQAFFDSFQKKGRPAALKPWFRTVVKKNFRRANQLGAMQVGLLLFLWLELRISSTIIQNSLLHFFLLLLFISALLISLYLLPVYLRYDLPLLHYFKQAVILMVISVPQTIAMILGILVTTIILTFLPILLVIGFVPFFLFPNSWFSFQAIQRSESLLIKET
ncbi:YesL family protein [Candidatus Enterenecus avicola]